MRNHKNWGIATLVFMLITAVSGLCEPLKKLHALWGGLTLFCLVGTIATGYGLVKKKENSPEAEDA